jgi:hypothetical protein
MSRKVGQIIARGERRWLVRVYMGRDHETRKRRYHNRTLHGSLRQAQAYLTKRLHERDLGRGVEGVQVTLNEYLDRWLNTAARPGLREKSYRDYEGMLRRYIRPAMGERLLAKLSPLDIQGAYQQMIERGLSPRSVRYTRTPWCVPRYARPCAGNCCLAIPLRASNCHASRGEKCECRAQNKHGRFSRLDSRLPTDTYSPLL